MKLIIGGAYQGKTMAACSLTGLNPVDFLDGNLCEWEELKHAKGICHFHCFIRRSLEKGINCDDLAEKIIHENPKLVIISEEIGCGIVPMDAFEREYREKTGRICTKLAAFSEHVYRVCCGVSVQIK